MGATGEVVEIALADLTYGPKVRDERLDLDHVARLEPVLEACPPIVVQNESMQVFDGFHRWNAATRRGWTTIRAVVVDLVDAEALEIAVKANLEHGLPLTIRERKRAAQGFLSTTDWSDARIASACGITDKTVAEMRPRPTSESPRLDKRAGSDNRRRPVDPAAQREAVASLIEQKPNLSDREVALRTGAAPSTVGDVRKRKSAGEPILPPKLRAVPDPEPSTDVSVGDVVTTHPVKGRWKHDPFVRDRAAQTFAKYLDVNLPDAGRLDVETLVRGCPAELAAGAASAARGAAAYWTKFAEAIERRGLTAVEAR